MSHSSIFNMPSGEPFLLTLAEGLQAKFGDDLQNGLLLLPTRRAVRAMGEAFVQVSRKKGVNAALLPRMRPLADINPEEPPFEPGELIGEVPPAIDGLQHRFELAKLIAYYYYRATQTRLSAAAALGLVDPLLEIIDDAAMEEVQLTETAEWQNIVAQSPEHLQNAAALYQIIETYWPQRLAELGLMESQARKVDLLRRLKDSWTSRPPEYPIIIAGSTGTLKATAELMRCVASLPKGMIVLPGLQNMPTEIWKNIDLQHPQYSLKKLIETLDVPRKDIADFPKIHLPEVSPISKAQDARRRVISEALVPVDDTSDWLGRIHTLKTNHGADVFNAAMEGLSLLEARTDQEEALAIALIIRGALETPEKTAALITPDQALAERVCARLARWNIPADMSQGQPLEQTPRGVFLDAILEFAQNPDSALCMSVLFNHPLTALGSSHALTLQAWQKIERRYFRQETKEVPLEDLFRALKSATAPLLELRGEASAPEWASALVVAAEALCTAEDKKGASRLWSGEAGEAAAQLLEGITVHGDQLPDMNAEDFGQLLRLLMRDQVVRPRAGTHPRLTVLGPLEARMIDADVVILGGLNEGIWPASPRTGPFLSRGMRREMRLSLPERRYGLAAHDFAELAAGREVFLTRAKTSQSGPMVASRWIWRLKTLLRGAIGEAETRAGLGTGRIYLEWADKLDDVPMEAVRPARAPAPTPPVSARWAFAPRGQMGLSMTKVQTWIRDPYSIYAQYILGLKKLNPLDAPLGATDFGSAIHLALENFLAGKTGPYAPSLAAELIREFETVFSEAKYTPHEIAKEHARFEKIAQDMLAFLNARFELGWSPVGQEIKGSYIFPDSGFHLRGVADYVEQSPLGFSFLDFKTGAPSSVATVSAGFDPQLPLAAFVHAQGGFAKKGGGVNYAAGATQELGYVRVKGSNDDFEFRSLTTSNKAKTAEEYAQAAAENLRELITRFALPETAYHSQPRVKYSWNYGEYDDLARRGEWAKIGLEPKGFSA